MLPRAPKPGKRVFLEHIPFIWKHLSFTKKVTVRNLLRYKKLLFYDRDRHRPAVRDFC